MINAAKTFTGQTASTRPAPTAAVKAARDGAPLKRQAFAAPQTTRCANWELRPLGALGFEIASARG